MGKMLEINSCDDLKNTLSSKDNFSRAIVIDEQSLTWGYRNLATDLIPDTSIPINDSELVHLLSFDGGNLQPIDYMPENNENKTPEDCFEAQYWEELKTFLGLSSSLMEKIKLTIFVVLAVGLIIVLFMIASIAMGG